MALTGDATEAKTTIAAARPVLEAFGQDANDLHDLLKSHALLNIMDNVDVTTQNLGGITLDARLVSDKISADYLKPKTPWSRIGHVGLDLLDIGAMASRHVP